VKEVPVERVVYKDIAAECQDCKKREFEVRLPASVGPLGMQH